MLKNQKKKLTWKFRKGLKTMKKKQPNLNLRKELLKSYILKLTNNRVVLIDDEVIRAANLTYSICQNRTDIQKRKRSLES